MPHSDDKTTTNPYSRESLIFFLRKWLKGLIICLKIINQYPTVPQMSVSCCIHIYRSTDYGSNLASLYIHQRLLNLKKHLKKGLCSFTLVASAVSASSVSVQRDKGSNLLQLQSEVKVYRTICSLISRLESCPKAEETGVRSKC